jgi:hypothetical protein
MIIFILVALVMSLNLYSYSTSLPYSDYGIVSRGFPFPILKSGSSIYVGHNGRFAQAVGVKHILEATGKENSKSFFQDSSQICFFMGFWEASLLSWIRIKIH